VYIYIYIYMYIYIYIQTHTHDYTRADDVCMYADVLGDEQTQENT